MSQNRRNYITTLTIISFWILSIIALWICYPRIVRSVISKPVKTSGQESRYNAIVDSQASQNLNGVDESSPWVETGQFGDTYGGFNALFSSLALCGVCLAAWLQYCQLRLQRKEMLQQLVPYIESETLVLRFLNCIPNKEGRVTWGLIVDMTIIAKGDKDAVNLVSQCQITDEDGKMLGSGACSAEGSVIAKGDKLRLFHHVVFESPDIAQIVIQRLCARKPLTLSIEFHYLNMLGGAFVRKKYYGLDCPVDVDRAKLQAIGYRIANGDNINASDKDTLVNYAKEVNTLITFGKDTFTLPLIAVISKLSPMVQKAEEECEYAKSCEKARRDIEKNVFPIKALKESFSIRI